VTNRAQEATPHAPGLSPGASAPLGATVADGGVNFCVYSRSAHGVELVFFDHADDAKPSRVIPIDPVLGRTYHYWHQFVPGVRSGQIYAYRVQGPLEPDRSMRFDHAKVLLDPYGRCVAVPTGYSRADACAPGDNAGSAMKSIVVDPSSYDWEDDRHPRHLSTRTVIYEMHVRGFTNHPSSGVSPVARGTFAGLVEKIPYLKGLGITAVELLPVFQYDPQDCPPGLTNYWGYAPVSLFSPHRAYSSRTDPMGPVDEFRDMVRALHRAGIEVILDVVYNHTSEGGAGGPIQCYKGFDNETYYMLENGGETYANYSGTGNTLNSTSPIVRRMILDSLRYWVQEMHVDGFRFDLASVLARGEDGAPLPNPPLLWDIESDPVLAGTKLIAEAWDACGLNQVGRFIGDAWKEWNGHFRDDVRSFFRGDPGSARAIADRLVGSPQIYGHKNREPEQSVNFITCHDGFTVNDLVSYAHKHNESNGEGNRDGSNDNRSWNFGVEGPTDDPAIETLRNRTVKNLVTATQLALGMPMILMGDEVRRTQLGNNNAYCHDDEISWFDWSLVARHADVHRFISLLTARRTLRDATPELKGMCLSEVIHRSNIVWHGTRIGEPDWSDASRTVVVGIEFDRSRLQLHFIMNAGPEAQEFELPSPNASGAGRWYRWIDTGLDSPSDIVPWTDAVPIQGESYRAAAHSVVALVMKLREAPEFTPRTAMGQ